MKAIVILSFCACFLSCGTESPLSNGGAPDPPPKPPINFVDTDAKPLLKYEVPEGIPLGIAEHYAFIQQFLNQEEFQFLVTRIHQFCIGEVSNLTLEYDIKRELPKLARDRLFGIVKQRQRRPSLLPYLSRTEADRILAAEIIARLDERHPKWNLKDPLPPAKDGKLSQANRLNRPEAYDCVEGFSLRGGSK